ncbi:MAG: hypothetical protein OSJ70_07645 [Bacilli bacterium]|nr:hypothetical protein [Bacilli bacterium]
MKIDRKDVYRVRAGAINSINKYGTKFDTVELNAYFCIPVRNRHGKIIAFNELKTGMPLVKRVYLKNECWDDEHEDMYYPYAYDKTREMMQVGDIDVQIDQDYNTEALRRYAKWSKENITASLNCLERNSIQLTCSGYDSKQPMDYYNKKLFLCYLDDDFIIISARRNPLGILTGYREIITGRKVIRHSGDEYSEFDNIINLNRQLMDPDIEPIDRSILATRELSVAEFEDYMDLTPEEVEAKISNYLAKLSRERVLDYEPTK